MKTKPILSIVIATFNSAKFLPCIIKAIKEQTFDQRRLEIIFADGGSSDGTLDLAEKYKVKVVKNQFTEPVRGKFLGLLQARGKYVMYIDHDEIIKNSDSIKNKIELLNKNPQVLAVAGGNYVNPRGYPFINKYINEFGDPFSFFRYRLSKANRIFEKTMRKRYRIKSENKICTIFDLSDVKDLPIIELLAGASIFNADYVKKKYSKVSKRFELITHLYYLLHKDSPFLAVMKDDPLIHYSADSLSKYLVKIKWRVKNNIYHSRGMGQSGFLGRDKFQSKYAQMKKYFFILYSFSVVLPFVDSLCLMTSRRDIRYFLHVPLTIYTAFLISYHYVLKILGHKELLRNYDESKVVTQ